MSTPTQRLLPTEENVMYSRDLVPHQYSQQTQQKSRLTGRFC
jgi:hypothetical protein